jgi:hypothetical protein
MGVEALLPKAPASAAQPAADEAGEKRTTIHLTAENWRSLRSYSFVTGKSSKEAVNEILGDFFAGLPALRELNDGQVREGLPKPGGPRR